MIFFVEDSIGCSFYTSVKEDLERAYIVLKEKTQGFEVEKHHKTVYCIHPKEDKATQEEIRSVCDKVEEFFPVVNTDETIPWESFK